MQSDPKVLINNGLNMIQQCNVTAKKSNSVLGFLNRGIVYKTRQWSHSHTRKTVYAAGHHVCR